MAISERTISVLRELSKRKEPARPLEIAQAVQILPIHVGLQLVELAKGGLAVKTDKDKNTWAITDQGRAYLKTLSPKGTTPPPVQPPSTGTPIQPPVTGAPTETIVLTTTPAPTETILTFPSQLDIFRGEGELLAVGSKKGEIPLDTIVKWVERMANLDDLDSIWNALTGLAIPDHIKKRWLQLYAQDLPKHKMTAELKEKIEAGPEEEKRLRTEGEVSPKPKRFSIVAGEIMGDPEGDYYFNEAFKIWAQQKGVPADQANPWATVVEAMLQTSKEGPQTLSTLLTALTPIMTRPPDTTMSSVMQQQIQALQTQIVSLTEERHKAEMESLRTEMRTGQKSPESDHQLQLLNQRLDQLRDELHQKDIEVITTQNKAAQDQMLQQISRLEQQIGLVGQGKTTDSKIGLMGETVQGIFKELSGARSDAKSMLPTLLSRGQTVKRRTEEEKTKFSEGLDKGIEQAQARKEARERLWPESKQ